MDDVLPPCGGYLPVRIDGYGYMRIAAGFGDDSIVHRETRDLNLHTCHIPSFEEAKATLGSPEGAILELTSEGGGAAVWALPDHEEELFRRLARFRGCYGAWPVRTLSI